MLLAQIDWNKLLETPFALPMLMVFGVGGFIALTSIIAVQWRKTNEVRLKEKMIDRGFTAEEIASVINARVGKEHNTALHEDPGQCLF